MITRFSLADLTSDSKRPSCPLPRRRTFAKAKTVEKAAMVDLIYALAASLALTMTIVGLLLR